MPGKYSHSVVLADFSSRGIISLPNEQHIAYLKSSPYPASTYSRGNSRAASQGSNNPNGKTRKIGSPRGHHDRPSTEISSAGRYVIVDSTTIHSQHDRMPSDQSMRKLRSSSTEPTPPARRLNGHVATEDTGLDHRPRTSAGLPSNIGPSNARIETPGGSQLLNLSPSWNTMHPTTSTHGRTPKVTQEKPLDGAPLKTQSGNARVAILTSSPPRASSDSTRINARPAEDSLRQLSNDSVSTQLYRPLSPAIELDFEGFSDSEETNTSYFEPPPISRGTGAPDAGAGMLSSLRKLETPPPGPVSQSRQSHVRTLHSSLSAPSDRFLTASPDDHQGKLNSLASQSSLGSWGTPSTSRGTKAVESSKVTILPQSSVERLPEIMEDGHFGPDLFSQSLDDVKPSNHLAMEKFGERPLGMVSSGRDVVFDIESDNQSLASAACPPDIGRFKADTSDAMHYLQTATPYAPRLPSAQGSPLQAKKNKGLFSRFRSKSRSS